MAPPTKLAIVTSSVRRLVKEEQSYHKELKQQAARIQKLEADKSDENAEYILKQEVRSLFASNQSLLVTPPASSHGGDQDGPAHCPRQDLAGSQGPGGAAGE